MTAPKNVNALQKSETNKDPILIKPDLKGDWLNFFLLILLYTMQGMPLGLSSAVPILLQSNKNVTYRDQVNIFDCHVSLLLIFIIIKW
jgi:PAT family acetyl-CoA transporter-like MFS transporter 1